MTSSSSSPPIEVGTHLTDFATLDLIVEGSAEGGFGLVVWGHNRANGGRMSALKLLRPDLLAHANAQSSAEGERLRGEFEREALTWCHLWPHADIITAEALTRLPGWDNLPVLALEYAPNGNLRQTLSEAHSSHTEHLSLEAALAWGQQIAAALAVIHRPDPACERLEPLVHCDLKPENVLFTAQGWAKLTDLGLTRAYAGTTIVASGVATSTLPDAARVVDEPMDEPTGSEREARVARMRAALQAAGLLTPPADAAASGDPAAAATFRGPGGVTLGTGQQSPVRAPWRAAGFQTRSVRVPPLSATRLATLLAPRPASHTGTATAGAAAPVTPGLLGRTEPGIGDRGPVAGTPPYMPPEQWWGLDAVTPASDVYALGVLLFELFAGGRWSPQQQRWLTEDQEKDRKEPGEPREPSVKERYVHFPHAPQFSAEALAYLDGWGGVAGQQAYFAAWYAAHRAGPRWRLADPAVGALTRGPLAYVSTDRANVSAVQLAVTALSDLIAACLAPEAALRPTAETVRVRLGEIARLVGLEPLVIPEAVPRTPENEATFWENLGITYAHIGRHEERLHIQRRVVALDPDNPQRWLNLGNGFTWLRHYEEALAAYAEAERRLTPAYLARAPQRAAHVALNIPNNQANALRQTRRYEEAVAAYDRVLAQQPGWADTRLGLALTFMQWSEAQDATHAQRLERLQAARQELHQVLTGAPNYEEARALLADVERALARLRGA